MSVGQAPPQNDSPHSSTVYGEGTEAHDISQTPKPLSPSHSELHDSHSDSESTQSVVHDAVESLQPEHITRNSRNFLGRRRSSVSVFSVRSVPRSRRRGLLGSIAILPEFTEPRDYPSNVKNIIVLVVAIGAMIAPMGTSIIFPAISEMAEYFDCGAGIVNVSVGIYLLAMGVFPLWWSCFSESFGRRSVYVVSFTLYTAFCIGCALSTSIRMFIGFRLLTGGSAASVQAVGAGTIGDIFIPTQRGAAMGWYYLGPLMGPLLAPIIGGLLTSRWGWRATQWFLVILGASILVLITFCLPETLRPEAIQRVNTVDSKIEMKSTLENGPSAAAGGDLEAARNTSENNQIESSESQQVSANDLPNSQTDTQADNNMNNQKEDVVTPYEMEEPVADPVVPILTRVPSIRRIPTQRSSSSVITTRKRFVRGPKVNLPSKRVIWDQFYFFIIRPTESLKFLKYPPLLLSVWYSAIVFFALYFNNLTVEYGYSRPPYNFGSTIIGLMYIPNSVGYMLSSILGGRWSDHIVIRQKKKNNGVLIPEERIAENVFMAAGLIPIALLIFGWTLDKGVHWVVPLVGTFLFGIGSMIVFGATMTYLVDVLPGRGASGVAVNNFLRMTFAAIATFVADPAIKGFHGIGWVMTFCAGLTILCILCLWAIKRYGPYWRDHSPI